MLKSKLSVITAVYNGSDYIEETVNSVLKYCSEIDFEYIVLNDGSTDNTLEILMKYEEKIRIIDKSNSGESDSVSVGFKEASGDLLLVVSADDPLFTDAVGKVIKVIKVPDYSDKLLIGRCQTLPGPGVIFRRSAALKLNGRNPKWTFVGDYDFWLRLSRLGELRHRPEVLAQWRHHPSSTSVSKRGIKMAQERIRVVEDFLSNNVISNHLKQMALGNAHYIAARISYFDKNIPAKKYLFHSFKLRKGWVEEAKFYEVLYILLLPFSRHFNSIINWIYKKIGRSNYGD